MMDDLFKPFLDDHFFWGGNFSDTSERWGSFNAKSGQSPQPKGHSTKTQHFLHFTRQKAGTHVVASGSCSCMVPQGNNFWGLHSNLPSQNDGTRLPIMINIMQIFPDSQSNCLNKIWNMFVYHLCRSTNPLQQETHFTTMGSRQQQQMFVLRRDFRCSTEDPKIWTIWVTNDRLSLGTSNVGHKNKGEVRNVAFTNPCGTKVEHIECTRKSLLLQNTELCKYGCCRIPNPCHKWICPPPKKGAHHDMHLVRQATVL